MKEMLDFYLNTPCEVKTMNNDLLLFGKLNSVVEEKSVSVVIVSLDREDSLPLVPYGTLVKIVLRRDNELMIIGGTVYICNEKFWRINRISQYQNFERRGFFRVSTAATGLVAPKVEEEVVQEESYPAQLGNISLSGVMFTSDHDFGAADQLYLHSLFLSEHTDRFDLICSIVAKERMDGTIRYRCTFDNLDARSADQLCKAIFELQRDSIKKMRTRLQ